MKKIFSLIILAFIVMGSYAQGEYMVIQTTDGGLYAIKNAELKQITVTDAPYPEPQHNYIWMPGNGNKWNHMTCPILYSENNDGIYQGYAYMDGDFKFTMDPEWGEERNNASFFSASSCIDLGDQCGGNISYKGTPGMCHLIVDDIAKTLTVNPCTWSIAGSFNGWYADADKAIAMAYNTAAQCLEANVTFESFTEWKFIRDNSWMVNLGGTSEYLDQDGPILSSDAGKYTIQLFIERTDTPPHAIIKRNE